MSVPVFFWQLFYRNYYWGRHLSAKGENATGSWICHSVLFGIVLVSVSVWTIWTTLVSELWDFPTSQIAPRYKFWDSRRVAPESQALNLAPWGHTHKKKKKNPFALDCWSPGVAYLASSVNFSNQLTSLVFRWPPICDQFQRFKYLRWEKQI
jgi:hypothetical protein